MSYEDTLIEEITTSEGDIDLRDWSKMHGEIIEGQSQLQIEAWTKAAESYGYYATKGHRFRLYIRTHDGYSEEDLKKDFEALKSGEKYLIDLRDHFYYGTRDFYCLTGTWTETGLTERQEWEVSGGMAEGLSNEEIAVFANPKFSYQQMFEIRTGFTEELEDTLVKSYADSSLSPQAMEEIREGYKNGLTEEAVALFKIPGLKSNQIEQIREGLETLSTKEVAVYASRHVPHEVMEEIREKMENGCSIEEAKYALDNIMDEEKRYELRKEYEEEMEMTKITEGYTHGGIFHADDVFSTALLKKLYPDMEVHRVFSVPENLPESAIVYDIGLGIYDHHQKDNGCRENGIPYAAFGKLWEDFGPMFGLSKDSLEKIDESLVQKIDYADNTGEPEVLSTMIAGMNPNWDEIASGDDQFNKAVEMAGQMLEREIAYYRSVEKARSIMLEAAKEAKNGVVVLDRYVPQQALQDVPDAKFVVFPSNRGGWNIQTVPTKENPTIGRVPFPKEWLGNPDKTLGMTFCHPGNFLASTETLEQAVNVANIAGNREKERASTEKSVNAKLDELEASHKIKTVQEKGSKEK